MRTKEEIATILAKRKLSDTLTASTWADLVASIQAYTIVDKEALVRLIVSGNSKKVGDRLKQALYKNAKTRAVAEVEAMLADDSLTMEELDSLI